MKPLLKADKKFKQLTSITHGAEDAFCDAHDCVCGLVVAPNGLPPASKLPDVLQEVIQGLADHTGGCADLLEQLHIICGSLASSDAVLHRTIHQLPSLYQLFLTYRGADSWAHDLQ